MKPCLNSFVTRIHCLTLSLKIVISIRQLCSKFYLVFFLINQSNKHLILKRAVFKSLELNSKLQKSSLFINLSKNNLGSSMNQLVSNHSANSPIAGLDLSENSTFFTFFVKEAFEISVILCFMLNSI
jgi:hypothetical protein